MPVYYKSTFVLLVIAVDITSQSVGSKCPAQILHCFTFSVGTQFLGPVVLEVPHFASLRGREREIMILRSNNGETWREHTMDATDDQVQDILNGTIDGEGERYEWHPRFLFSICRRDTSLVFFLSEYHTSVSIIIQLHASSFPICDKI